MDVIQKYNQLLDKKRHSDYSLGFNPVFMPDFLFDYQKTLVEWALKKGRCGIFADCGLGKTPLALVIAQNIVEKINKNVLIVTPLSVTHEFLKQGEKFGIEIKRSKDGKSKGKITVTNYEKLHMFDPSEYAGNIFDESSIIKNPLNKTKYTVSRFTSKTPYRFLMTATAAPNDYPEFGNSSEVLGNLDYNEMLSTFFRDTSNDKNPQWSESKYVLKNHAVNNFWKWITSWARALRKPSDLGFSDEGFILPEMNMNLIEVKSKVLLDGYMFYKPAKTNDEQREEKKKSVESRSEIIAETMSKHEFSVAWPHFDSEADYLEKILPESKQVSGKMSDDQKEEIYDAFSDRKLKYLIIKPKIGAFGLNWQHCNHTVIYPTHSYEQAYQGIKRFHRYGQTRKVQVDIPYTESEMPIIKNFQRKVEQADVMFVKMIKFMNDSLVLQKAEREKKEMVIPEWI